MTDRAAAVEAIEASLTGLVRRANTPRAQQRLAQRAGLSLDRALYVTLVRIDALGAVRLTDLADDLGVDVSTSSRQVRALEEAGYVRRVADPADGRSARLATTDEGARLLDQALRARRDAVGELLDDWPDDDLTALAGLLERVTAALTDR